jgi:rRNA maturation protein Nop10
MKNAMPWDLLNPNTKYVSQDIYDQRLETCKSCDRFITLTSQCKECGCFMKLKCAVGHAFCPLEKWQAEEV